MSGLSENYLSVLGGYRGIVDTQRDFWKLYFYSRVIDDYNTIVFLVVKMNVYMFEN